MLPDGTRSARIGNCYRLSGLALYIRASKLAYIPQGQSLLSNLTVAENVFLPHTFTDKAEDVKKRTLELLDGLGIKELADSYPQSLSGGERRRSVIARSLINNPLLILADEPTSD